MCIKNLRILWSLPEFTVENKPKVHKDELDRLSDVFPNFLEATPIAINTVTG